MQIFLMASKLLQILKNANFLNSFLIVDALKKICLLIVITRLSWIRFVYKILISLLEFCVW